MTGPFIIETERGRLILNRVRDQGCITLETGGSGVTQFLDREALLNAAGEMIALARQIKRG